MDQLAKKVGEAIKRMYSTADEIAQHNVKFDLEWIKRAMEQPMAFPPGSRIAAPFQPVSVPIQPAQPLKYVYGEFTLTKPGPKRPLPYRANPPWNLDD